MLIISGHYDGGHEFFSEHVEASEFLPVAEMERVSCSGSCHGTLLAAEGGLPFRLQHAEPRSPAQRRRECRLEPRARADSREPKRNASCVRSTHATAKAAATACGSCSRMCRSSTAFLPSLHSDRRLQESWIAISRRRDRAKSAPVGQARACWVSSQRTRLTVTRGMNGADPLASVRRDVCQFADDRISDAQKLDFVHQVLQRPAAEVRMLMERIDLYVASLGEKRRDPRRRGCARGDRARRRPRALAISLLRAMPIRLDACADAGPRARSRMAVRRQSSRRSSRSCSANSSRGTAIGPGGSRPRLHAQSRAAASTACSTTSDGSEPWTTSRMRRSAPASAATKAARAPSKRC